MQLPGGVQKGVLSNFAKFTGKHLRQSSLCYKVAGLRPATLLKNRLWHICFPANFAKFLKTFSYRTPPVAASVKQKINVLRSLLLVLY